MSELIEYLKLLFSTDIVIYSFIVGVLISASAAALGVVLVLKKYSMIGDGLSHVSFAAVAVAVATGNSPMLFSIPVVMISAFFILRMSESSRIRGDAATAIFSTAALAVGAIASRGTNVDIESYLFGSITALTLSNVILTAAVASATVIVYIICYNRIFAVTFDETYEKASDGKPGLYNALIAALTALVIVVGMRLVGALLISALLIFPALSSMRIFKSFFRVVISSVVISLFCFIISMTISIFSDISVSACMVLCNLAVYLLLCFISAAASRSTD